LLFSCDEYFIVFVVSWDIIDGVYNERMRKQNYSLWRNVPVSWLFHTGWNTVFRKYSLMNVTWKVWNVHVLVCRTWMGMVGGCVPFREGGFHLGLLVQAAVW